MRFLVIICFWASVTYLCAQQKFYPGTLITDRDSISGLLSLKKSKNGEFRVSFRESGEKPAREIIPQTGTQVLINRKELLTAAKWNSQAVFFETLVAGEYASLLRQNGTFFILLQDSVILLENAVAYVEGRQVVKKKYVGTLGAAMFDCPSLLARISETSLTESDLAQLVKSYNKCKGVTSFEPRAALPKSKPSIGVSFGVMQTRFRGAVGDGSLFLYGYFNDRVIASVHPSIGLSFDIPFSGQNRSFLFSPEIRFSTGRYQKTLDYDFASFNVNRVTIENHFITVPLLIAYLFSEPEENGFLVKAGALTSYNVSRSFENQATQSGSPQVPAQIDRSLRVRTMQHGFTFGFGYRFWLGKSILKGEVRYENYGPFNDNATISINKSSIGLIVNYAF